MEDLITEAVAWAREHAVTEVSLNFAVFADFLVAEEGASRTTRSIRWLLLKGDRLFQLKAPFFIEHHQRGRCDRLGHGEQPEYRSRRHLLARLDVGIPEGTEMGDLSMSSDQQNETRHLAFADLVA